MSIGSWARVPLPWPESATDGQYALAAAAIGVAVANAPTVAEKATVDAIAGLVSDRIERFAPDAPVSAKREAARRYHGYLKQAGMGDHVGVSIDDLKTEPQREHTRAFRLCGALGVLTPYRSVQTIQTWDD